MKKIAGLLLSLGLLAGCQTTNNSSLKKTEAALDPVPKTFVTETKTFFMDSTSQTFMSVSLHLKDRHLVQMITDQRPMDNGEIRKVTIAVVANVESKDYDANGRLFLKLGEQSQLVRLDKYPEERRKAIEKSLVRYGQIPEGISLSNLTLLEPKYVELLAGIGMSTAEGELVLHKQDQQVCISHEEEDVCYDLNK